MKTCLLVVLIDRNSCLALFPNHHSPDDAAFFLRHPRKVSIEGKRKFSLFNSFSEVRNELGASISIGLGSLSHQFLAGGWKGTISNRCDQIPIPIHPRDLFS